MKPAFEWMVAARYLRPRRRERFVSIIAAFSLLGIFLGVATLIIVLSVMNGFRADILARILGINGHVIVQNSDRGSGLEGYDALADRVRAVTGVAGVSPVIDGQVWATGATRGSGAFVRGMRPEDLARHPLVAENVVEGTLGDYGGTEVVVIGNRLAQRLGVGLGDSVNLLSPQGTATAFGTVPRRRAYRIAATFEMGMFEYDSSFVFMPLEAAQIYFRSPAQVHGLEVMLGDPEAVDTLRSAIFSAAEFDVRLTDWRQVNSRYFNALKVERNVMFIILTLIILVAVFNIISILIMLVKDKGPNIAILRTMGATRGMILRIFFIAGAAIGVVGTALGFAAGLAFVDHIETIRRGVESLTGARVFAEEIYFLSQLPAKIDGGEVAVVVGVSLALSFLATLYPSWRAARLDPVEALRYE